MMFRFVIALALVLCVTKATVGAAVMWTVEVARPTAHQVTLANAHDGTSHSQCVQFPHGCCNFLITVYDGVHSIALVNSRSLELSSMFSSFEGDVPINPPIA